MKEGLITLPQRQTETILKGILCKFISILISAAKQIASYVKDVGISLSEKSPEHQSKGHNGFTFLNWTFATHRIGSVTQCLFLLLASV